MKKKASSLLLSFTILASCFAQQKITITGSNGKEGNNLNIHCNNTCIVVDVPELNGNPAAILFVTPVSDPTTKAVYPHSIAAYYANKQWSILNLDNAVMLSGTQFNVQYYIKPDTNHFVHIVTQQNLQKNGSYIDHPGLNNNPNAQFQFFQNCGVSGGIGNRYDIQVQYDATAGRWYMSNTNNKQMSYADAYNIAISSGGNANTIPVLGKSDIIVDPNNPKILTPSTPVNPVIGNAGIINKAPPKLVPGKTVPAPYDFSNIRICTDKINNSPLPPRPPVTNPPVIPKIKPNGDIEQVTSVTQPLSLLTDKMWNPGETITVGFSHANFDLSTRSGLTDNDNKMISKIEEYAREWTTYANIHFDFIDDVEKAAIKVAWGQESSHWSLLGRDVLINPNLEKTMNIGIYDMTSYFESELREMILHEFGHALGFIHEHQAPIAGNIPWDKEKVYAYFAMTDHLTRAEVDQSIFYKYSQTETNSSAYDKFSIMHYFFPPDLTTDHSSFELNTDLSPTDKAFAGVVYPFPTYPSDQTGTLMTGDDCDEIDFSVEYHVIPNDMVEFILLTGRNQNGNPTITWWKGIGIALIGGVEVGLEIQDGSSSTKTTPFVLIDKSRGISFSKAKWLGNHTRLNFTWPVFPAIIGGCRVTLTWRKDHC